MTTDSGSPSLLQNLRSRKLPQWLLAYAAGAWVLLQVLSLLAGAYHWPDAALRANPELLPLLRLRVADIDTRLADLTGNNRPIMEGLRAIAREKP